MTAEEYDKYLNNLSKDYTREYTWEILKEKHNNKEISDSEFFGFVFSIHTLSKGYGDISKEADDLLLFKKIFNTYNTF